MERPAESPESPIRPPEPAKIPEPWPPPDEADRPSPEREDDEQERDLGAPVRWLASTTELEALELALAPLNEGVASSGRLADLVEELGRWR